MAVPKLDPAILVIFGITGDLAKRKLLPSLYHLFKDDVLDEHTEILGLSRREIEIDDFLGTVELCVQEADNVCDPVVLRKIRAHLNMLQVDPTEPSDYKKLGAKLDEIEATHGVKMNRLFNLSIPPQVYAPVIRHLGAEGLQKPSPKGAVSRLLVEKPFGYDLRSAEDLISETDKYFSEDQVFRIDHYLAKESAQNILVFRRHNAMFERIWNKEHISGIHVIAYEKIGIEGRGNFYDQIGALRDLIQSHLLQLLTLATCELPDDITNSNQLHSVKQALLESIHPVLSREHSTARRGQYTGYRDEVDNQDSMTETYAELTTTIGGKRWEGVPITLSTGKNLADKSTQVIITFKGDEHNHANRLTFRIQPNEGIGLELIVKRPGFDEQTERTHMDFSYHGVFDEPAHPEAYERVFADAIRGDRSLFATNQEVLAAWRVVQPVLTHWSEHEEGLAFYEPGSKGPQARTS